MKIVGHKLNTHRWQILNPKIKALVAITCCLVIAAIGLPRYRLVGASGESEANQLAIIEELESGRQLVVEQGAQLGNDSYVVNIKKNKVEIYDRGESIMLGTRGSDSSIITSKVILDPSVGRLASDLTPAELAEYQRTAALIPIFPEMQKE